MEKKYLIHSKSSLQNGFIAISTDMPPRWLVSSLPAIPAILLLAQILQNWVNIPFWDEWNLAYLRIKLGQGTLSIADLFVRHNDSRFFFPNLIVLPLDRLTHWDVRAEMLLTFGTACAISVLLSKLLRVIPHINRAGRIALLLVCNSLLFSPILWETWLWGINFTLVVPALMLLASLRVNLLSQSLGAKVGLNILFCTISTFSNANGMGNWLLAFPGFASSEEHHHRSWLWYAVYAAVAAGTLVIYFSGTTSYSATVASALAAPTLLAKYFFCWLGAPLGVMLGTHDWFVGVCVLITFIVLGYFTIRHTQRGAGRNAAYAFLAIGGYAILAGAATSVGRVSLRFEWALSSRYMTFSIYLPIAIVGLAALAQAPSLDRQLGRKDNRRRFIAVAIVVVILTCSLTSYKWGIEGMRAVKHRRLHGRAALLFSEIIQGNSDLKILAPESERVISRYKALLRVGMAKTSIIPRNSIPTLAPVMNVDRRYGYFQTCALEKEGRLKLTGWALDSRHNPAPFVLFAYRSQENAAVPFAVAPTQVTTRSLAHHGLRNCGFFAIHLETVIPKGLVEISAWSVNPDRKEAYQLQQTHSIQLPSDR